MVFYLKSLFSLSLSFSLWLSFAILVSQSEIESASLVVEVWSLNHWSTRELTPWLTVSVDPPTPATHPLVLGHKTASLQD